MTRDSAFRVEIHTAARTDVFLSSPDAESPDWRLVQQLDRASVAVVSEVPGVETDIGRLRELIAGCCAAFATLPSSTDHPHVVARALEVIRTAVELERPLAVVHDASWHVLCSESSVALCSATTEPVPVPAALLAIREESDPRLATTVEQLVAAACACPSRIRPYAFLIGRLERDFTHARAAIRAAVEREAGIPCLWADDGHQTNVTSVRENTRLLIQHAAFVIADLTLGTESPERENPSRAHEIGMTIAYERPLMLTSQEPRRYPYFSIGDMQMTFWSTEADLHEGVRDWIRRRRGAIGRRILNYALPRAFCGYEPSITASPFAFDPLQRYIGPKTVFAAEV